MDKQRPPESMGFLPEIVLEFRTTLERMARGSDRTWQDREEGKITRPGKVVAGMADAVGLALALPLAFLTSVTEVTAKRLERKKE